MHRAHERGELGVGLALRAQRDDERGGLHVGDAALEELGHRGVDLVGGELGAARQLGEDRREDFVRGHGQSHQKSWSSTPRAISPSCTCDVPSTIVSCFASR